MSAACMRELLLHVKCGGGGSRSRVASLPWPLSESPKRALGVGETLQMQMLSDSADSVERPLSRKGVMLALVAPPQLERAYKGRVLRTARRLRLASL